MKISMTKNKLTKNAIKQANFKHKTNLKKK